MRANYLNYLYVKTGYIMHNYCFPLQFVQIVFIIKKMLLYLNSKISAQVIYFHCFVK